MKFIQLLGAFLCAAFVSGASAAQAADEITLTPIHVSPHVWYFRGEPHVHVWVNVAADAGFKINPA